MEKYEETRSIHLFHNDGGCRGEQKRLVQGFWGVSSLLWYNYLRERPYIVML